MSLPQKIISILAGVHKIARSSSPVQTQFGAAPVTADSLADNQFTATAAAQKALVVQGAAAQTANVLETQSSTGAVSWGITASGGLVTGAGVAGSFIATAPTQTAASQAGVGLTFTASAAVDGSSTHAAAAGGNIVLTAGSDVNGGTAGAVTLNGGPGSATGLGGAINLNAGSGNGTGDGGPIALLAGSAGGTSGNGGAISVTGGTGTGNFPGGAVSILGGNPGLGGASVAGGAVSMTGGTGTSATTQTGGAATVLGGTGFSSGGALVLKAGPSSNISGGSNLPGTGGNASLSGGTGGNKTGGSGAGSAGTGGNLTISGGNGGNASVGTINGGNGGNVTLVVGTGGTSSGGTAGSPGVFLFTGPSNTASALGVTDGTNNYYTINTQMATSGVAAHKFTCTAPTIASDSGAAFNLASLTPGTVSFSGTTTITALNGLSLNIASPTVSNTAGSALTATTASAVTINGPLTTTSGGGSMTVTNAFAVDVPTFVANGTLAAGLRVAAPTGAATNCGILLTANPGIITTSVDLVIKSLNNQVYIQNGSGQGIQVYSGGGNLGVTGQVTWNNNDTGVNRLAATVIGATNGSSGGGWFQNTAGESILTNAFTRSDTTLTATNLSITVINGRYYAFEAYLQVANSVAAEGFQMDFNGGSATVSGFSAAIVGSTSTGGTLTPGTTASTSLSGVLNASVVGVTGTNSDFLYIKGSFKATGNGTVIIRAAENTHATGTMTLSANSYFRMADSVAV